MAAAKKETKKKTPSTKTAKPKLKRKRVTLAFKAEPGSEVFVAGTFNNWNPSEKKMKETADGEFSIQLMLPSGEHEYKIISNGRWLPDPNAVGWSPNPFGSFNSVIRVES